MSLKSSATRYARALLDVAIAQSDPARIEGDLAELSAMISGHAELTYVLTNPRVPVGARTTLIRTLAERAAVDPIVGRLLALLTERSRLELLPAIVEVYRERLLVHRKVVRARITSSAPLAPEHEDALGRSLSRVTGQDVHIEATTDPALIGGLVARIGSTVYDGSVRTQLQKVRQQLLAGAGL